MSQRLIDRSPDLKRMRDEGYDLTLMGSYLVVRDVPYVNERRQVKRGVLVSDLDLAGDVTTRPGSHVVYFAGEFPHQRDGAKIRQIEHSADTRRIAENLSVNFSFSNKPADGYRDYHHKMTTYIVIISGPAGSLDPSATPHTFPVIHPDEEDSPFEYLDTASSRCDINVATNRLRLNDIAIVGLGGTGSYVLDFVAKCPIRRIHLIDGDVFGQHNAFRSPGAASIADLEAKISKVAYYAGRYSSMHRGVVPHPDFVTASNAAMLLRGMQFVFVCVDRPRQKQLIFEALESLRISFIDVGLGVSMVDESLIGILRVTASTPEQRAHIRDKGRVSFAEAGDDDYDKNIQVADLNCLNAALAVIKWKKLCGFYRDELREHHSTYTIDTNMLLNDDCV